MCTILWSLLLILKHYLHTIFPVVLIDLRFYKQFGFELYLFNIINPSSFLLQPRLILLLFVENFFHQITRNATKYFHVMVCADVISIYKWNIWKHDNDTYWCCLLFYTAAQSNLVTWERETTNRTKRKR